MRLIDGAIAIGGDLPSSWTTTVEVPPGAGSSHDSGVDRLSSIERVRDGMRAALGNSNGPTITIGGDCGVELAAIEHANIRGDVAVVWLDAHPDLNTPASSPSRAFHGMVLRTLLGDGPAQLVPASPLLASRVVLAGTRALDDSESDFIDASGIDLLGPNESTPENLVGALLATGAASVYLHIDLDVLDPSEFTSLGYPEPFGLSLAQLLDLIAAARRALPLAGAGITEFAPSSASATTDELPVILRVIGALTKKL
ncbi:MAG: arginase family protein [Microbacteriaceae bacterium]|nr:arginase family protein [Microbacteriaceae bacterium]